MSADRQEVPYANADVSYNSNNRQCQMEYFGNYSSFLIGLVIFMTIPKEQK